MHETIGADRRLQTTRRTRRPVRGLFHYKTRHKNLKMGTVFAAEASPVMPSPPMPGMPVSPPVTATAPAGVGSESTAAGNGGLPNPGSFEDLFKKVKG